MFGKLGWPEIILILVIVVLLFGAKRLPDTARALGRSLRILKSETKAMKDDGSGEAPAAADKPAQSAEAPARTIQAAPGDVTQARPVGEPDHNRR
ncbi:Sec-independent protein translocase subunit TatA [Streptomyces sp. SID3343]|uniref:Sec-independent protein translocase subunit TatA n=1 Tax=Streptomyces sp. SID3343 TaxID=2690260 RepID=UPI0013686A3C|nr:Sec-independent protein translocase subunit TatA [Streptomyces sp. SID3343]MYW02422.1 twin-arginine translocase TatA/TatE family subunit [Streptomyces sp. SID3343]